MGKLSTFTRKRIKDDNDPDAKEHLLFCNHSSDFENFPIFTTNNNEFEVTLMESLLIKRDHPPLNKNKKSLPLKIFDG